MKKLICAVFAIMLVQTMYATPSTQIWIPSTDVQQFKTVHLNIDNYVVGQNENNGSRKSPQFVIGPTVGFLPFEKLQGELGFDIIQSGSATTDNYPFYFHGKLGTPEDSMFAYSPAIAGGIYNAGTKSDVTNQNIVYGLAAKTLPVVGRFSAGYYFGNDKILVNENGKKAEDGLLLSWDRTMSEISDKLWLCVDYQGGNSSLGAFNFGFSWAVAKNTSLLFGYDIYNNPDVAGKNTFTFQVDVNLF
jgi:hypothetical protein